VGIVRLFLALLVLVGHVGVPLLGIPVGHGHQAVFVFYVISGFYMAMILSTTYRDRPDRHFYASRYLRLMPVFLIGQILILAVWWNEIAARVAGLHPISLAIFGVGNVGILGLDSAGLACLPTSTGCLPGVATPMNGPTWTLAVELGFYLAAPLIVRSTARTLVLIGVGIAYLVAITLLTAPVRGIPWLSPAFPPGFAYVPHGAALLYFGVGALAWRLSGPDRPSVRRSILIVALLALPLAAVGPFVNGAVALAFALALPILFRLTRSIRGDRFIGELSFPVYVVHVPIFFGLEKLIAPGDPSPQVAWERGALTLVLSLAVSVILILAVERQVDRFRRSAWLEARLGGRPSGSTPSRPDRLRAGVAAGLAFAWLLAPLAVIGTIAVIQRTQQTREVTAVVAELTDATWDRGVDAAGMRMVIRDDPAYPIRSWRWASLFYPDGKPVWVTELYRSPSGLVLRLQGNVPDPDVTGAPAAVRIVWQQ